MYSRTSKLRKELESLYIMCTDTYILICHLSEVFVGRFSVKLGVSSRLSLTSSNCINHAGFESYYSIKIT